VLRVPAGRFSQVIFVYDVVTVKDAPGFMAAYHHCHPFMDAGPHHFLTNSGAPEVMENLGCTPR